jgi:Na+:H+ antiporter, NhaC family
VATWSYAPFAVFSMASPLITVAFAYAGIRMIRVAPRQAGTTESPKSGSE